MIGSFEATLPLWISITDSREYLLEEFGQLVGFVSVAHPPPAVHELFHHDLLIPVEGAVAPPGGLEVLVFPSVYEVVQRGLGQSILFSCFSLRQSLGCNFFCRSLKVR